MKKTIFLIVLSIMLCGFFYSVSSSGSGTLTPGTINACVNPTCARILSPTTILLKDAGGNVIDSCTLPPNTACCTMNGDYPTGTYHFTYFQAGSFTKCNSTSFSYTNGTTVSENLICLCP